MLGLFPCQLLSTLFHASYWLAELVVDSYWFQILTYNHYLVNRMCHSTMEQGHPTMETIRWISTYLWMETEFTHTLSFALGRNTWYMVLISIFPFIINISMITTWIDSMIDLYIMFFTHHDTGIERRNYSLDDNG